MKEQTLWKNLKAFFKRCAEPGSPYNPSAEERKELETLGYHFNKIISAWHGKPVTTYQVKDQNQQSVGKNPFREDEVTKEYLDNYNRVHQQLKK